MKALFLTLSLAIATLLVAAPQAHAEDKRPCVSTTEYAETADVMHYRGNADTSPTRRELERRWEVRRLGVVDAEYSDKIDTMWMYPVCGYSFNEAQVWVLVTNRTRRVGIISLWVEPGAMSNGHIY